MTLKKDEGRKAPVGVLNKLQTQQVTRRLEVCGGQRQDLLQIVSNGLQEPVHTLQLWGYWRGRSQRD